MKTWEKLEKLDREYQKARYQLILGEAESVEVKVSIKKSAQAALLTATKVKKNGIKFGTSGITDSY